MGKRNFGFTIVELLIVIVVIGILASISVASFTGVQQRAKDATLRNDLTQAAKAINLWLIDSGNSVAYLRQLHNGALWIAGNQAQNSLPGSTVYWNSVSALPRIEVTPWTTLEIIAFYSGSEPEALAANASMLANNKLCMTASAAGSKFDYRAMSGQPQNYNKILFYDGMLGGIYTIEEIGQAFDSGKEIICAKHLASWRATLP